jgi:hypothetical protein
MSQNNADNEHSKFTTIFETFTPFKVLLCLCGFLYNGGDASSKSSTFSKIAKFTLSVFYSVLIVIFFFLNLIWGEQEPESSTSMLINHGWHKLHLFELLMLPVVMWNNFSNRDKIDECMKLFARYDFACQVNAINKWSKTNRKLLILQQKPEWKFKTNKNRIKRYVNAIAMFMPLWVLIRIIPDWINRDLGRNTTVAILAYFRQDSFVFDCESVLSFFNFSYVFSFEMVVTIFICHFIFVVSNVMVRFQNFLQNFNENVDVERHEHASEGIDEFICFYEFFENSLKIINSIFWIQVN